MSKIFRIPFFSVHFLLVFMLFACSEEEELGGSLTESYDLSFDHIRARLYPTELAIEYVREDSEVIVRLTVRLLDTGLSGPAEVDLKKYGGLSGSSGGQQVPSLLSGTLFLRAYSPEQDAKVEGDFDVLLQGTRTDLTLYGHFSTSLDLVQ